MVKVSYCLRRLPHLSREEFHRYWREVHPFVVGPETVTLLGLKRYNQVHTLNTSVREQLAEGRGELEDEFDGIAELWVESLDVLQNDWAQEDSRKIIQTLIEDEKNFIDWSRSTILISREINLIGD